LNIQKALLLSHGKLFTNTVIQCGDKLFVLISTKKDTDTRNGNRQKPRRFLFQNEYGLKKDQRSYRNERE